MAALAYLFPPLSGMLAFSLGRAARVRFHGLQSVVFGFLWPAAVYAGSLAGQAGTRVVAAAGALAWLGLFALTLAGRDPQLPGGSRLRSLSGG